MAKAYKAKWIITSSNDGEQIYEDSALIVENGIITDIIPNDNVYGEVFEEVLDYKNAVITPGFINLCSKLQHTDVFKTKSKGFFSKIKRFIFEWHKFFSMLGVPIGTYSYHLADVEKEYKSFNKKDKISSFKNGLKQALLSGTTCIAEVCKEKFYFDILNKLPIKTFLFFELFSDSEKSSKNEYEKFKTLINNLQNKLSNSTYIGIYPHSLLTVHKKLWEYISNYARENDTLLMTELMESKDEYEWYYNNRPDLSYYNLFLGLKRLPPEKEYESCIEYLDSMGILNHNTIVKNGNYLTTKELRVLSERGVKICLSPKTNKKIFDKFQPKETVMEYFKENFGFCTGDLPENDYLSPLEEMYSFNLNLPTEELLKYITIYPAKILRVDNITGSLEKDKHADFNVFKLTKKQTYNDLREIKFPADVYIMGHRVVNKGEMD